MTVSPLLQRTYAQPLSLELLAEKVPVVKDGYEATQTLKETERPSGSSLPYEDRQAYNDLLKRQRLGSQAQEELIVSALPLIKNLASQEFNRRKAWASRISYEDILQDAIAGFIRGLLSYKPANTKNSATNYLGQWVVTTVRRRLEAMDHDFHIPFEVVDRNRRIVAVKSRLTQELKRDPSDEELLEALNDETRQPLTKLGRRTAVPSTGEKKNRFTMEHIISSRALAPKLYAMASTDVTEDDSNENKQSYERHSSTLSYSESNMSVESVDQSALDEAKHEFFLNAFVAMRIGSQQKDIILRHFGMRPYDEPQNYKEISGHTGMSSRFVKSVITAFSTYMPTKGGVFHQLLSQMDETLVVDLELDWLVQQLGEWHRAKPVEAPSVLIHAK